ncbi:sporulation integral membrane protein YlbJ [Priestia flexa]|uniref:Sporulation integral membrane protein YlbJ n=1 Tax=Priestia flexa TaxID=86664 RepID=A0A8I1MC24_9BACI|nr:sporulation integral membrane protein YlbJ [Priestia flexa]MBN8250197.1 sporulation integral membrane protein YlbJ [Priestia flexa]MBN8432981.1 sporulation integral membrane protein YlbJ [Priestia flexa]MCA0965033.1 sporulation integral membrane protein YlbJ [Priestia flexa]RIV15663.1 sporulation integral membrane protein YlbJ [Priestia flexa]UIR29109.1 sporulation integral membrane protein YlbJ [Priestia flexa]
MNKSMLKTIVLGGTALTLTFALLTYPKEALEASVRGLNTWWKVVFPSLLPFFILSELLIGFGVVRFIGSILEPLMRPLFRVPGVGGFALAMGMGSGFPSGAKITARLRQEEQLSKTEAERLVSFTNSSNPIFIFGAVAVGFFSNAAVGIILAFAHYLGNILVGLVMRFYGKKADTTYSASAQRPSLIQAFKEMHEARIKDQRPIGKLLGDAVLSSVQSLLMIGGFIILFSVLNKLLFVMNITTFISSSLSYLFSLLQLSTALSLPFISGLFEITMGSQLTSQTAESTLFQQVIIVSFILGFSGFSVHAQVASILAETDIRFFPFFCARLMHGLFASILAILAWKPFEQNILSQAQWSPHALPTFLQEGTTSWSQIYFEFCTLYGPTFTILLLFTYSLLYMKRHFPLK